MTEESQGEQLTLWAAIKDLGWFFWLFSVVVGAPSILQIIQFGFPNFQLIPLFQWIPDGWERLMAVLGAIVEPVVQPAIDWLNTQFGWDLKLDPVWRIIFSLYMIPVVGGIREFYVSLKPHEISSIIAFFANSTPFLLIILVGSLFSGLVSSTRIENIETLVAFSPLYFAIALIALFLIIILSINRLWILSFGVAGGTACFFSA